MDYRLVLASESKPGGGAGFYTDMMIYPPVERVHHFCGLGCLDLWRDRARHRAAARKEWGEQWKQAHVTSRHADGRIFSYEAPPEEVISSVEAEFEAAALAAFPMKHANAL